jgi:phytoene desaturase
MVKSAIVIGAGMGGLAAALRLQQQGFDVTVLEKQSRPGGRSNVIQEDGFRVDRGPTILVMKEAFDETYRALGLDINQRLEFQRLDPNYRIYFNDNTSIDLFSDFERMRAEVEKVEPGAGLGLERFMRSGEQKYRLGMDFVERNYDHITDLMNLVAGLRLLQTRSYERLYDQVGTFFKSDKLRKAFSFHSMFLGLSPFRSLAMYSLITYADLAEGMWYPKGGIYSIIEDMLDIANERGVRICTDTPVRKIIVKKGHARGVMLESGDGLQADLVISNADLPYTYKHLVDPEYRRDYPDNRLDKMDYSCSGFLLYLGVDRVYPDVRHQALYFSEDYKANLDAIFERKTLPDAPSFHLNIPTVTDASLAPPGHSLLYVLAPMPNLESNIDWDMAAPKVREQLLDQLEKLIDPDLRQHIVWERQYTPVDFKNDINAVHGTAFGSLSQGFFQSAYFRPHNKARDIEGLYFVGQGTYPGIGMPMVLISARLVTERIVQEWR